MLGSDPETLGLPTNRTETSQDGQLPGGLLSGTLLVHGGSAPAPPGRHVLPFFPALGTRRRCGTGWQDQE